MLINLKLSTILPDIIGNIFSNIGTSTGLSYSDVPQTMPTAMLATIGGNSIRNNGDGGGGGINKTLDYLQNRGGLLGMGVTAGRYGAGLVKSLAFSSGEGDGEINIYASNNNADSSIDVGGE